MLVPILAFSLPLLAQTQTGPTQAQDFQELLRQYQQAFEAEQSVSEVATLQRETTTASVASRLNTPSSRAALWQTISNATLPAEVRLAAIDALRRMGDVSNIEQLVTSLGQIRKSNDGLATRVDAEEAFLRRHREEPKVTVEALPREAAPVRASAPHPTLPSESETVYKRNLIFGGIAAALAVALLIIRKRH